MSELIGQKLGKYQIVSQLGKGGMAEVYKAYHPDLERYVAIKLLHAHVNSPEFAARFKREAAAIAKLRHPNIVQVYDFDTDGERAYMVMELIEGTSLQDALHDAPLSLTQIRSYFLQLLNAVAFAHANDIVHRDLKPANILLEQREDSTRLILTDFGIARTVGMNTETGAIMGTPAYMSPEQGQGERGDARSDIYALGIILYELTTGRIPFTADNLIGLVMKQIQEAPEPPSAFNPELPPEIEAAILKALSKSPDERFQTVDEMRRALGLTEMDTTGSRLTLLPAPGEPPYKGLEFFDQDDANLFFGRSALTSELLERVGKERFLAVVGASGSGKSSVVRAGVVPAWAKAQGGHVHIITPSAHPLESLALSLTRESESVSATATLSDDLLKDSRSLFLYVKRLLDGTQASQLLLVVDQFEEVFTLCKDAAERKAFIDNLLTASNRTEGLLHTIFTVRADFYQHCAEHEGLRQALQNHQAFIGAMSATELREAIEAPATANGWSLQEGLVDLILQDVGEEPGALPLLSHALLETWKRRQGRMLTLNGYTAVGGVRKAIAQTAESVLAGLQPEEQRMARNIFLRLTELGEGVQDSRRRANLKELTPTPDMAAVTETVLQRLTEARLITMTHDSVEVAHEALIREWPTLREWLVEDREQLRMHRHLTASATEWERRGRERGELYAGTRLAQALEWLTNRTVVLSPLEQEYLRESQNQLKRAQRSRQLRWAGAAFVAVLGLIFFTLAVTGVLNPYIYRPVDMENYWVTIPAGPFQMGSDTSEDNAKPAHTVNLDAYEIGRYEVTNRQYAQCVKAGVCNPSDEKRFNHTADPLEPVVAISWFDANTYCSWLGARLPTEAQWEKAARGGLDGKLYPWGDGEPSCQAGDVNGANFQTDSCGYYLEPVGIYTANGYGLYDMTGNVWEWVSDYYAPEYYKSFLRETTNPFGPSDGTTRVIRGGGWTSGAGLIQVHVRSDQNPDIRNDYVGFRCARNK